MKLTKPEVKRTLEVMSERVEAFNWTKEGSRRWYDAEQRYAEWNLLKTAFIPIEEWYEGIENSDIIDDDTFEMLDFVIDFYESLYNGEYYYNKLQRSYLMDDNELKQLIINIIAGESYDDVLKGLSVLWNICDQNTINMDDVIFYYITMIIDTPLDVNIEIDVLDHSLEEADRMYKIGKESDCRYSLLIGFETSVDISHSSFNKEYIYSHGGVLIPFRWQLVSIY